MNVTLERLAHSDINLLRELRNANADAFFDDTYITREAQEDWWYRYELDKSVEFMTIWLNHLTPVGFLSVRVITPSLWIEGKLLPIAELGHILLAPAYRGQGIMTKALIELRRLYDPLTIWVAHVKSTNLASKKLFAAQGFVKCEPTTARKQRKAVISEVATDGL